MPLIDFTPEQQRQLQQIIRSELNSVINTQNRPNVPEQLDASSAVYVALVPEDGIPALTYNTQVGTSSSGADGTEEHYAERGDIVGFQECEIYRINVDANLLNTTLEWTGRTETVYNLDTATVTGPKWISIHKDRWGRWLAGGGGGVCDSASEIQHIVLWGKPTGGSFNVWLMDETINIPYNATAEEVEALLQEHTQISDPGTGTSTGSGTGVLIDDISVAGGPLPNTPVVVYFIGDLANTPISLMYLNISGLTGGIGVGGVVIREQRGRA